MKGLYLLFFLTLGIILCAVIWLSTVNYCPFEVGDSVIGYDGKNGSVVSIRGWGSRSKNCAIAVQYEDGTLTEDFVYNWHYSRL